MQTLLPPKLSPPTKPTTNPWTAALLSLMLVGYGQLCNRQLAKAATLAFCFYILGGGLVAGYFWLLQAQPTLNDHDPPDWYPHRRYEGQAPAERAKLRQLRGQAEQIIHAGMEPFTLKEQLPVWRMCGQYGLAALWLFAVLDAFVWANRLRRGTWVIRFSLAEQRRLLLKRLLPVVFWSVPHETISILEWTRLQRGVRYDQPRTFLATVMHLTWSALPVLLHWLSMGLIIGGILLAWPVYVTWGTWLFMAQLLLLLLA